MSMRSISVYMFLIGLTVASPALAGIVNYADGTGSWQSTKCMAPQNPPSLSSDPEVAANELNEQFAAHNKYVEDAQAYMNCLSKEAQADVDASNQTIVRYAQSMIQETQATVDKSAQALKAKSKR